MQILMWLLRLVLFLFLFGFAIKNDQLVTLHFYFGGTWQLPLVFVILAFFAAGALLGVTATLASWLTQRREIARLKKTLKREADAQPVVPRPDGDAPEAF